MDIQINTDRHIAGGEKIAPLVESVVSRAVERFADRITRIEVHLTDESSSAKSSEHDKRCVLEARLGGLRPIAVSHRGATVKQALEGAGDRLEKALTRTLGRLDDARRRTTSGGDQVD